MTPPLLATAETPLLSSPTPKTSLYVCGNTGYEILIDYSRDSLLSDMGRITLKDTYMTEDETSPQEAFARAACYFADNAQHAQRLYDYVSNLWFMYSTPVLANGGTKRGLPISCFVSMVDDSRKGLSDHYDENIWLSTSGGGIGTNWSAIRSKDTRTSKGSVSTGLIPFLHCENAQMLAFQQGKNRRGSSAAYLDVSHPEIEEFIEIRKPSGGDSNRKCLNIHHGVNITDAFMQAVKEGKHWPLIDPHSKEVKKKVSARELWIKILETRVQTGEPYLHFIDTANRALPKHLKEKGLRINSSQLCQEIHLPTTPERTAVCCLSSVNLEKWDEWHTHPLFIEDLLRMLDNVLTRFIHEAPEQMWRARFSAMAERSVGLGAMGFHSFLQSKMIPFESVMAKVWNNRIFSHIKQECDKANLVLGKEKGSPTDAIGTGLRLSHTRAIAPNASSSIICGNTSPSIEPHRANAYTHKTIKGSFPVRNKHLVELLKKKGKNTAEVWDSIITSTGSVQHLDFLSQQEKDVFKTAMEIDQRWIVELAADRAPLLDQGQSVNLFVKGDINVQTLHNLHFSAWEKGVKGLYYLRSEAASRATVISSPSGNLKNNVLLDKSPDKEEDEGCLSCQG